MVYQSWDPEDHQAARRNGKNGKEGKDGPRGPPGMCNDTELIIVKEELENKRILHENLVGHWKMDEESLDNVDDDSGHGCHGVAVGVNKPNISRGKYSRGRRFDPNDFITVANCPSMKFGNKSFTFSGWLKIEDYTYPLTNFAVLQGGCQPGLVRSGFIAGWDIGHSFKKGHTEVCVRDDKQNVRHGYIKHNNDSDTSKLQGKWTNYVVVFDRSDGKIQLYINGKKQRAELDITTVPGSIDNDKPLVFGYLHGWQTKGTIDEYRLYKGALTQNKCR